MNEDINEIIQLLEIASNVATRTKQERIGSMIDTIVYHLKRGSMIDTITYHLNEQSQDSQ